MGCDFPDTISFTISFTNRARGTCPGAGLPARFVNEFVYEIVSGIPLVGWDFPDTISFTISFTNRARGTCPGTGPPTLVLVAGQPDSQINRIGKFPAH